MNKIRVKQIDDLDSVVNGFVDIGSTLTITGVKTFTSTTSLSRPMLNADRKLYSFYANPQPSIWESAKLDIAEPNQFRKFNTDYIDITASLTEDGDDWDTSLIRNIQSKNLLTSVDGTAYVSARIRENDIPTVKRVKVEITCDPTSGQVSGTNSRMWLTNLCVMGNTTRGTHRMSVEIFSDNAWSVLSNDTTRSKSAEFINHICHPQLNFGTGAVVGDYTRIRIIFYDFQFLSNVQPTSELQIRKIWWFGPYPNKINKPTSTENINGDITYTGNINSSGGKLATENWVTSQIPQIPEANVIDVSDMFEITTSADVSAFMFKRQNGKHLIRIHGFDNSGRRSDLEIIPTLGFGPQYSSYQSSISTLDGINFLNYAIKIDQEGSNVGRITIPDGLLTFDITYYLHDGSNITPSYYVDTNGVMHHFTIENTPIDNFVNNATQNVTINGQSIVKSTIRELSFGEEYLSVTSISSGFLYNFTALTILDLCGLENITTIGSSFLGYCTTLLNVDISPLSKVTTIDSGFLSNCRMLQSVDFEALTSLQTVLGRNFLENCYELKINIGPHILDKLIAEDTGLIGAYSLYECRNITSIEFSENTILQGANTLASYFIYSCWQLTSVKLPDLSNIVEITGYFLSENSRLTSVDISSLTGLKTLGGRFLNNNPQLRSINIGGVNWNNINVSGLGYFTRVPNTSACTLYADSEALANAFKDKFDGALSNWTIVVNP